MTVTVHAAASSGTNDLNSHTTASFTPAANSRLYAACSIMRGGHSTAPSWSDPGGGLTWTPLDETSLYNFETDANYAVQTKLWYADIGGSPSSTSLTFAPGTSGGAEYASWVVWSQTNDEFDTGSPYPQASVDGGAAVNPSSDSAGGTLTLGSAPSSSSKCFAVFGVGCNVAGGPSTPSGWTLVNTLVSAEYININLYSRTGSTSTDAAVTDLGQDVGNWAGIIFEVAAAGGGSDVDITGVGNINAPTAFGTNQVSVVGGVVGLSLTGLAVATAFGTAVVAPEITLTLNGVAVPTAFGTSIVAVSGGPVGISLSGIAVPVSFFSSDTGGELEWQAVGGATDYRIKYGTTQGGPYGSTYDTGSTATSVNVSLLTVTPGTRYYAVVCPMDGATEGDPSPEISFVPGAMQLSSINQLAFSGLAVPTAFGTGQVSQGGVAVGMTLNGVAVPTSFGTQTVAPEVNLALSGVAVPTAFGTSIVAVAGGAVTLDSVGGIAVPTNFGTSTVAGGARTLTLSGIAVPTQFGLYEIYDPLIGPPRRERRLRVLPFGSSTRIFRV